MNAESVANASFGASAATGMMTIISDNATAITVISSLVFGCIYVACAIWNAHSNHRRNKVSERSLVDGILSRMRKDGASDETLEQVIKYIRK